MRSQIFHWAPSSEEPTVILKRSLLQPCFLYNHHNIDIFYLEVTRGEKCFLTRVRLTWLRTLSCFREVAMHAHTTLFLFEVD